jgi:signal transduction histidine kinase
MSDDQDTIDRLTRELAQKATEARVLQEVSTRINSTLDLEEILGIVLGTMDELFGFSHALVLLLDDAGEQLTLVASRGYPEGEGVGTTVKVGVGVVGMVAKRRKTMRVNNLGQQRAYAKAVRDRMVASGQADQLEAMPELPGLSDAECQIAIPLMIKDQLIGVFAVESADLNVFGERDEVLAHIVANQAAAAINNARMYRDEEQRRKELAEAHASLKQLTETLEDRVRERTAELEATNRELRDTQSQLVHSEKMASLGKLVAGVAHELNTPIGSIASNADLALRTVERMRGFLEAEGLGEHQKLLRSLKALEQACKTELQASERVASIVKSLRNFARLDEAEEKRADLHEGIRATLEMMQQELGDGIEVVERFGELPPVLCFPNQLNQAFMAVLLNAAQATAPSGTITIRTEREGDQAVIRFADTGAGIAAEDLGRVFDPGFTTKGVGVGTGLGLSISYQIVDKHNGSIAIDSTVGEGTTVTFRLPIDRD